MSKLFQSQNRPVPTTGGGSPGGGGGGGDEIFYIDPDDCISCAQCVGECPVDVIKPDGNGKYVIMEGCISCGACEHVCPVDAISPK